ncbi:MAG: hypothetical protein M1839_002118 [Geoglossum umbratile]|nr:MAG: hypothetical protein M1839_002118 [Geoglossum umbratile]
MSVGHNCSDIELMADTGTGRTLSPDSASGLAGARFPPFVIEVAFPREGRDLSELASTYIASSSGNVRLVVGIDIQCLLRRMGMLSVWWPVERSGKDGSLQVDAMRAINDDLFRFDGFPLRGDFSLVIPLAVFRFPGATTPLPFKAISIPHQTLRSFLIPAEDNGLLGLVEDTPTGAEPQ